MGVVAAIGDLVFGRAGAPAATTAPPASIAVQPVPFIDARTVMGLSAVWRCVTLIADTIADMPWTEWRGEQPLTPSRLVRRPYALMTRREWTWRVVASEALFNVVHLLHVGGSDSEGAPWSLLPLPPAVISPGLVDPWGLMPPTEYVVAGRRISAEYVTVIRRTPIPGITDQLSAILDIARRQFTAYVAADVHVARYWANGGPTLTQIVTDQELDNDQAAAISQRWADMRAKGAEFAAVLGKGSEAKPFGADPTTDSAVAARMEMNADIGRHFGVPTRILNAPAGDSETYSNVENDAIDLHRYTLRGYMGPVEDAISELLPGDYLEGRRMQLDPARFLQGSLTERATAWLALTSGDRPIADVDEARVRGFGMPPRAQVASATGPAPAAITPIVTASITQEVPA